MAAIAPNGYSWGNPNRGLPGRGTSGSGSGSGQVKVDVGEALPFSRSGLRVVLVTLILLCIPAVYLLWLFVSSLLQGDLGFTPPWR